MARVCPSCDGQGRVDDPVTKGGLACLACGGTGNAERYLFYRAYLLGREHGIEAMREALPGGYGTSPTLGLEELWEMLKRQSRE